MQETVRQLVQSIHDSPGRVVLVTAGAGTHALAWLLGVAGASRTLLEALVPYDWRSFNDFLGQEPEQYVAPETARMMAGRALTRGRWLHQDEPVIGLACTATIATDRPKRGDHRAHVATWQPDCIRTHTIVLDKGARDRRGEEEVVSLLILNALAQAYGLEQGLTWSPAPDDEMSQETADLRQPAQQLYRDAIRYFSVDDEGAVLVGEGRPSVVLSGAFNPLHDGHLGLARAGAAYLQQTVAFELAARNADKAALAPETVLERAAQFAGRWSIYVSNAATFVEKARLYPDVTFLVGFDTATRVIDPRFYNDSDAEMRAALAEIRALGCQFVVAGRANEEGEFHTAADLQAPPGFADLFRPLPGFRRDISSTELRASGQRGSR